MILNIKPTSLKSKLLNGILLLSLLLIALYSFYFLILYKNLLKYEEEKINIYIKSVSININKDVINLMNKVKTITTIESFRRFNIKEMRDIVLYYEKSDKLIKNFFVCDINGDVVIRSSGKIDFLNNNFSSYGFFKMPIEDRNIIISDNYTEKNLFISLSAPIFSDNNNIIGVIIIFLSLENKDIELFQNIIDPDSYKWEILMTNKKGILLYDSHNKIDPESIESIDYSNYPSVQKALLGNLELTKVTIDNKSWYTSSEIIPTCDWYVIVQVPRNLIINNVRKIITPNIILLIILIILLIILILFWANRFINPITKLTNAIKEYGEKGTSNLLVEKSDDEIHNAMKTFNKMVVERRQIEREILEIIEKDRKRIGNDLHDDLEKSLSGIYHQILILKEELNKFLKKENLYVISYLDKISKILNETINKTKLISDGLCPVSLYEGGLINSILELVNNTKSIYNLTFNFDYDKDIIIKDEITSLNLYYITHEAIQNSVKYDNADKININFKRNKNDIILKIEYHGSKIENNNPDKNMSIRVMNYSAKLINAELNIENKNNKIIIITCSLKNYDLI